MQVRNINKCCKMVSKNMIAELALFSLAHKSNPADHVVLTTTLRRIHFPRPSIFSEMELEPVAG